MAGPANAIVGDNDSVTNLPQTQVPEAALTEEKKMAKYSQSAEFKRLKEFMEARIKFYQRFLPNGERVEGDPKDPRSPIGMPTKGAELSDWKAACVIINEFENILREYSQAQETVKEHATRSENA